MRPRLRRLGGLRGRLLLALVLTSMVTLAAAAAVVLSPLQQRLRDQSIDSLRAAVLAARPRFEDAMARRARSTARSRSARRRSSCPTRPRGGVLVTDLALTPADNQEFPPGFLADSESGPPPRQAFLAAVPRSTARRPCSTCAATTLAIAVPLYHDGGVAGAVVARRRLTEVANAAEEVRKALLAAAAVGLPSRSRSRRARQHAAAPARAAARGRAADLRRGARPPDAARRGPRRGGRPRAGARGHAGGPAPPGVGAAGVRRDRLARAADAADDAPGHDGAARGGPRRVDPDSRRPAPGRHRAARAAAPLDARRGAARPPRLDAAVALRSEAVELGELARAVAAEFGLRAGELEAAIEVVPPTGPCWGRGDPDAVARVVRILIDNALRYGGGGDRSA